MNDDIGYRNIWISLGVGLTLFAIVGAVFLRHADEARAFFGLLCLMLTIILCQVLDSRERKHSDD
jgi:hypothetical protein